MLLVVVVIAVNDSDSGSDIGHSGYGSGSGGGGGDNASAAWHRVKTLNLDLESDMDLRDCCVPPTPLSPLTHTGQGALAYEHDANAFMCSLLVSLWVFLCVCRLWMKNPFLALPSSSTSPDQKIKG